MAYTDTHIDDVAAYVGVSVERVRRYLDDLGDRDIVLLRAFHHITGFYPMRDYHV